MASPSFSALKAKRLRYLAQPSEPDLIWIFFELFQILHSIHMQNFLEHLIYIVLSKSSDLSLQNILPLELPHYHISVPLIRMHHITSTAGPDNIIQRRAIFLVGAASRPSGLQEKWAP